MAGPSFADARWRPLGLIAQDALARVWLVEDPDFPGARLARKELLGATGETDRLQAEFATRAAIHHPGLVELVSWDPADPAVFVSEYVEGDTLAAAVAREGPELLVRAAVETLLALGLLHDLDLPHLGLKPGNLRIRAVERLGVRAALLDPSAALRRPPSSAPAYLAPEQLDGSSGGPASDLYALGTLLHEAIHGRPPLVPRPGEMGAFAAAARAGRRARPPLPAAFPAGLRDWLEELLAPEPSARPRSAGAALDRLARATGRRPPRESLWGRSARIASGADTAPSPELAPGAADPRIESASEGVRGLVAALAAIGVPARIDRAALVSESDPGAALESALEASAGGLVFRDGTRAGLAPSVASAAWLTALGPERSAAFARRAAGSRPPAAPAEGDRPTAGPVAAPAASVERRLRALYEMIRALNSTSDPDALLETILDAAIEVVGAGRGLILLFDGAEGDFTVRLARGLDPQTVADAERFSRGIAAEAGAGRSVLALDARTDARFREMKSVSLFGIHSIMCVPLRSRGRMIGSVYLDRARDGRAFDADDLRFLEAFADHAGVALDNARDRARLERENRELQREAEARVRYGNIVGESSAMRAVFALVDKAATSDLAVLIRGESGTGKELIARAIHFNGPRRLGPFVSENCAALADSLLQSELFGHVRGAFTGADRDRQGLFEQADGGTLFLDEIGDMSATMQAQLLRVLEERRVRRVGDERARPIDVRVLAATHRDLARRVAEGRFREDLLYRLQVIEILVPPLRERGGDVRLLVRHLLDRIARERGAARIDVEPEALEALERHDWPGNVRQLENALERLALVAEGRPIGLAALEADPSLAGRHGRPAAAAPLSLEASERERIRAALEAAGGSPARAARMLGISRATIYRKLKELDS